MPDPFGPGFLGRARLAQLAPAALPSAGRHWWAHHIANTRGYLEGALSGDTSGALWSLGELWHAVLEWQRITGSPMNGVLMAEHTALAKLLVDCLARKLGQDCLDTADQALGRNVEEHRRLFSRDPAVFADLFGRHVGLTGKYVTALADGRQADFEAAYAQALENGAALGAFTDRVFGRR